MNDSILIIEDERKLATVLAMSLEDDGYTVHTAFNGTDGLGTFAAEAPALVITDLKLPDTDGISILQKIKAKSPETEVILMTAFADAGTAVQAMKAGAYDYLTKPFDTDELLLKVRHIFSRLRLSAENTRLKHELQQVSTGREMVGKSAPMRAVSNLIDKVAERDVTVLIRGESGTGKELVARAIHNRSPRATLPFMAVNCGALPESLLESELFGYEKGAFTGADKQKIGYLEAAAGGTIFLDEIGDITPAIQVKLLRVLEERQITRLGGTTPLPINARLLTATNRDLEAAIEDGSFREDLYYRLNVFPITIPPLRDRKDDIPALVAHFLGDHPITAPAMDTLTGYRWTGNVRELENILERAEILAGTDPIAPEHLAGHLVRKSAGKFSLEIPDEGINLEDLEQELIHKAITKAGGNKSRAAELLGITRRTLYSKMERYGKNDLE